MAGIANESLLHSSDAAAVGGSRDLAQNASANRAKLAYLFLLLFAVVIFGRPEDIFPILVPIPWAKITGALAILSYLVALVSGRVPLLRTKELKIMFALTVWFIVSLPFAYWKSNSLAIFTDNWSKTFLIFFLLSQTTISLGRIRKLLWAIILCGLIAAGMSIALQGNVAEQGARMTGVNWGFFATFYLAVAMSVMVPFMGVFFVSSRSLIKWAVLLTTVALMMWMVILSAFRSDFLSVFVTMTLTWLLVLRGRARGRLLAMMLVCVVGVAVLYAPGIFWDRISTLWSSSDQFTNSASVSALESKALREAALRHSLWYTVQHPIFGLGIGNFPIVFGSDMGIAAAWIGTHNVFTQLSSEAGLPGIGLFIALLGTVLRNMWKICRATDSDPHNIELHLLARATIASTLSFVFAGFFVHVAYDFFFYYVVGLSASLQHIAQVIMNTSRNEVRDAPLDHSLCARVM